VEAGDHVGGLGGGVGVGDHQQPGVVVDDVEDLDVSPIAQLPVGDVGLPAFVGLVGFEAHIRALGPLLRLGSDKPSPA
jgi:hypothetical protein